MYVEQTSCKFEMSFSVFIAREAWLFDNWQHGLGEMKLALIHWNHYLYHELEVNKLKLSIKRGSSHEVSGETKTDEFRGIWWAPGKIKRLKWFQEVYVGCRGEFRGLQGAPGPYQKTLKIRWKHLWVPLNLPGILWGPWFHQKRLWSSQEAAWDI